MKMAEFDKYKHEVNGLVRKMYIYVRNFLYVKDLLERILEENDSTTVEDIRLPTAEDNETEELPKHDLLKTSQQQVTHPSQHFGGSVLHNNNEQHSEDSISFRNHHLRLQTEQSKKKEWILNEQTIDKSTFFKHQPVFHLQFGDKKNQQERKPTLPQEELQINNQLHEKVNPFKKGKLSGLEEIRRSSFAADEHSDNVFCNETEKPQLEKKKQNKIIQNTQHQLPKKLPCILKEIYAEQNCCIQQNESLINETSQKNDLQPLKQNEKQNYKLTDQLNKDNQNMMKLTQTLSTAPNKENLEVQEHPLLSAEEVLSSSHKRQCYTTKQQEHETQASVKNLQLTNQIHTDICEQRNGSMKKYNSHLINDNPVEKLGISMATNQNIVYKQSKLHINDKNDMLSSMEVREHSVDQEPILITNNTDLTAQIEKQPIVADKGFSYTHTQEHFILFNDRPIHSLDDDTQQLSAKAVHVSKVAQKQLPSEKQDINYTLIEAGQIYNVQTGQQMLIKNGHVSHTETYNYLPKTIASKLHAKTDQNMVQIFSQDTGASLQKGSAHYTVKETNQCPLNEPGCNDTERSSYYTASSEQLHSTEISQNKAGKEQINVSEMKMLKCWEDTVEKSFKRAQSNFTIKISGEHQNLDAFPEKQTHLQHAKKENGVKENSLAFILSDINKSDFDSTWKSDAGSIYYYALKLQQTAPMNKTVMSMSFVEDSIITIRPVSVEPAMLYSQQWNKESAEPRFNRSGRPRRKCTIGVNYVL